MEICECWLWSWRRYLDEDVVGKSVSAGEYERSGGVWERRKEGLGVILEITCLECTYSAEEVDVRF